MKLMEGLKDSLKDLEALINVYNNQVSFNKPINLIEVCDTKIEGHFKDYSFLITGKDLVVCELSNITVIKGLIKKVLYEHQ